MTRWREEQRWLFRLVRERGGEDASARLRRLADAINEAYSTRDRTPEAWFGVQYLRDIARRWQANTAPAELTFNRCMGVADVLLALERAGVPWPEGCA